MSWGNHATIISSLIVIKLKETGPLTTSVIALRNLNSHVDTSSAHSTPHSTNTNTVTATPPSVSPSNSREARAHISTSLWDLDQSISWDVWTDVCDNFLEWISTPPLTLRRVPNSVALRFARTTQCICEAIWTAPTEIAAMQAFLLLLAHHRILLAAPVRASPGPGRPWRQIKGKNHRWDRQVE